MKDLEYKVQQQWHSKPSPMRVICVGAGSAGLCVGYKMKKKFKEYELVIYEKNPSVAGTWYENRYPGCACDVPAHSYTYTFEPNPDWSSFYAYAPEIRKYFDDFATKHELHPFVKLNSKVISATWNEDRGIYDVEVEVDGRLTHDWCHVIINATGFLNSWKWPAIEGLHDFQGPLLHSANWDDSIDYKDKTVAVIGTGSSAIQIVPQVQKSAKHITTFMRSVTWISPPFAAEELNELKEGTDQAERPNAQYYFSAEEKKRFRENPDEFLEYRTNLEAKVNSLFDMFVTGSETSKYAEKMMREEMNRRIGPGNEELKERLIPKWAPGCRRITPGDGYLEALVKPNVTRVHDEIAKILPEGLVDDSGKLHKVDIIVCATGFNLAFAPPFKVTGVNGVDMAEEFGSAPNVYLALTVPKFPNYFVHNGVRGNWASGTSLPSNEVQVEYILQCIQRMQEEGIRALEVKEEPVRQLYEHIDEWHKCSVWNDDCKSWYKNNIVGGKLWIWGGSALHYMKTIKTVRWEHYDFRYHGGNMWSFLGNGRVRAEEKGPKVRLAPYVRNSDTPWDIE
ncbi:cyclohexanone monooxygenase [Exophiala viscosa]|uniref:cyclohexanone monooxygenase n=1 Tax=Exophiala viscosa TaxID=2486360 RepID=UPI00218F9824|nr:cyclohexanone monooxygenase [Exophiala viscosa]